MRVRVKIVSEREREKEARRIITKERKNKKSNKTKKK